MAKPTLARGIAGGTEGSGSGSQNEQQPELFGDPPRKRRVGRFKTTVAKLEAQLGEMPKSEYVAGDNDLPLVFWKEPSFDE